MARLRKMSWIMSAATGAIACTIADEAVYTERRAAAECGRIERCYLGEFESQFSSRDDCESAVADELEQELELLEDCEYDPREAKRCVHRVNTMSCEDWIEKGTAGACDLVFLCD